MYGTLNRLLIPFGLHHILNFTPWFQFGEYTTDDGTVVTGDIQRFLNGDPTAGAFMTGFFPIMMLPCRPPRWRSGTRPSQPRRRSSAASCSRAR